MTIIIFLMSRLTRDLEPQMRSTLVGTALVIFFFRAIPTPGPGVTWWLIDELKFDQQFFSILSLVGSVLSLLGMFIFRRFMAEKSIVYIVGTLTVFGTLLALPTLGMVHGLHHWTAAMTGGVVDARVIALIDTALESPLGQVAMIPMLAWIARSAPDNLKATYFAVMASFTNLALSLSQLGTKYLNQIFEITRATKTATAQSTANYTELGPLLLTTICLGFAMPFIAIAIVKLTRFKSN
jgi:asparagine N-glycosylation enzyme membrane subunit Stt3